MSNLIAGILLIIDRPFEISDRIGAGAEIGALLGNAVIDVHCAYGTSAGVGRALLVFKTNNVKRTLETLK